MKKRGAFLAATTLETEVTDPGKAAENRTEHGANPMADAESAIGFIETI
ncbi:hypothetical protein [Burkholderia sp. Ac-20353]|nr:hypothetical protein [Burkholderia sp. Ac-20353]MBN3785815.1 hypothetical protein [Burkholderia sp. Ac-20353]